VFTRVLRRTVARDHGAVVVPELILAVDDSMSMRQLVRATLQGAGYRIAQAANGVEALEYAKTQEAPRLVLTDVNMPEMDGLTLVRELRALPDYKHIPILVLTTESGADLKKRAKEIGATGWIVKPFSPQELLATVKRVI
jgi:two-component system, chemotaxis family, chemotaxis protein CheY